MTALTAARPQTKQMGDTVIPTVLAVPVKASVKCYQGGLAVLSAGYAAPATAALGLKAIGRFRKTVDNSSGADGALTAEVESGCFKWGNSANADAIAQADVGKLCYAVDDQTVAKTDNNGARSPAGIIVLVDTDGVWVLSSIGSAEAAAGYEEAGEVRSVISVAINLADIATGVVYKVTPGFAGRIVKAQFTPIKPATTAAKAATLQPRVSGVATTGGAVALTSANMTPAGNEVDGTAITAANTFGATDYIDVLASAVTTFVEGSGILALSLA